MSNINHLGIIVDGNGRWAKERGLTRSLGHKKGADNLKNIILYISNLDIKYLSLYIFSTENFKREKAEVDYLMNLFINIFNNEFEIYKKNNIKIIFSGRKNDLNNKVVEAIEKIEKETINNTKLTVNFCLNYGSQYEIIDAINKALNDNIKQVDIKTFNKYLYQDLPNIDFLIRTSGEKRLSNFMLYQSAYAELYFTNKYFPDFNNEDLKEAIDDYLTRHRRFGGL